MPWLYRKSAHGSDRIPCGKLCFENTATSQNWRKTAAVRLPMYTTHGMKFLAENQLLQHAIRCANYKNSASKSHSNSLRSRMTPQATRSHHRSTDRSRETPSCNGLPQQQAIPNCLPSHPHLPYRVETIMLQTIVRSPHVALSMRSQQSIAPPPVTANPDWQPLFPQQQRSSPTPLGHRCRHTSTRHLCRTIAATEFGVEPVAAENQPA